MQKRADGSRGAVLILIFFFRGLSIHSFHGNCFVRTTDLLALPTINPDAGFGMQVSIEENLSDLQNVSFQAALLYTSSQGMSASVSSVFC